MRSNTLPSRLAAGLIGSAAVATLLAPAASGATPVGHVAATAKPAVAATTPAPLRSMTDQQVLIVNRAPIGAAGPAAPAPIVVALGKEQVAELGKVQVKQGYINEQQAAWQGAGAGAAGGAAVGALVGVIAGGLIGGIFGVFGSIPGIVVGAISGAISGAITGAIWGAVGGAVNGYLNGQNQARAHNNAVRKNGGKPVSAQVSGPVANPVDQVVRQAQAFLPQPQRAVAPKPVRELREIPDVKLPPQAHRAIDDAKRAFAHHFGIRTPRR
ncbi:hypothetical protein [Gordonia araii]|nr:hypothetical protein [Gordonia araii]NNG97191.1 hypothetical protein [Gordonia araii NBRC 100433]